MGEDACRANVGHSPQNLASFRNVSLSLLRLFGVNEILSTLRQQALRFVKILAYYEKMRRRAM